MLLSRILGAVGRTFISVGVLTLLFVAYQLWGTGLLTARAQAALSGDFATLLDEAVAVAPDDAPAAGPDGAPTGDGATGGQAPSAEDPEDAASRARLTELLWRPAGEAVARLSMPTIDVDEIIVAGVGTEDLQKGPGHYRSTPLPGMPGNAAIAGHRTTWGAPFHRIDELAPGDEITVRTVQGEFVYRVLDQGAGKGHFIVTPDRVDVLDQGFAESPNRLTLTACHPKYSARQRIIVVAELVGEPAEAIARPGTVVGDGLAGEDGVDDAGAADGGDDTGATVGEDAAGVEPDAATGPDGDTSAEATDPDAAADSVAAAATEGTEDFGEGLDGDSSAVLPAVLWGLAAASVWGATAFVGRRWRRMPSYAMGVVPFAVVLFVCFMHIDRALPSY